MTKLRAQAALLAIFMAAPGVPAAAVQSSGVYGGYVGSDAWFSAMRRSAANRAMLQSLSRSRGSGQVPPGYIEFAGVVSFPQGNPFPKKRLPDLIIRCRDKQADSVERQPFVDDQGGFYTVFKRSETYDLYWSYYFGSKEKFATIAVPANAPSRLKQVIEYRASVAQTSAPANQAAATATVTTSEPAGPPPRVDEFDLSGFPKVPTNFEEQQVLEDIRSAKTPALKTGAHDRLARYYEKRGDLRRAQAERSKADYWRSAKN